MSPQHGISWQACSKTDVLMSLRMSKLISRPTSSPGHNPNHEPNPSTYMTTLAQSTLATLPKLPPGLVVAAAQAKNLGARLEAHAAVRVSMRA